MKRIFALVLTVAAALASDALAAASFQPLGLGPGGIQSFAWDVSADGSVMVGHHWVPNGPAFNLRAARWASGTFQDLGSLNPNAPEAEALAVSDDGMRVVGWSRAVSGFQRPFLWTPAAGMRELPNVPGSDAIASDISRDGRVIVGYFLDFDGYHAFRWEAGVVTDLGFLPGGRDSKALAVCGSGAAVVGSTLMSNFAQRTFRWRPDTGMQNLGGLQGVQTSYGEGCSDDGSVVVGASTDSNGNLLATRWDSTGTHSLGALGGNSSEAHAVSANGAVIVGGAGLPFVNEISEFSAFRWDGSTRKMEQLSRMTVTTAFGAAAGAVSSKQDSSSGQPLVVSSGQTGSACFQSNDKLELEAADKRLADWSGDPAFACKDGSFGENRCELVLGTTSQSITATPK